ncbi:MAG TPA: GAF domain-containing protein [Kofleriaceae bacterium]|nr:GAF domain-containing protein [Kofleriaceae bacterium]
MDLEPTDPQAILRLLPHGVLVVASDWRVLYANPEAERMLGSKGATLWERCPELEHTAFASGFRYALADRTELLTESALPSIGWCQARAKPTADGGLLISLRQVHAGTIETGQAKQALLIGEIGDALTREESLSAALERCTGAMVRNLDAAVARIWTVDEHEQLLELCGSAGVDMPEPALRRVRFGEHRIGQIAEDGTPYLTNDVATDPTVGANMWTKRERLVAFAGYPLRIEDRIVGVMAIYSRRPIDHDLLNSLSSIADALALGIDRKRATAARRVAEDRLRTQAEHLEVLHELGKQLVAELDVQALVQKVTHAATRLTGAQVGTCFFNVATKSDGRLRYAVYGARSEAFASVLAQVMALAPGRAIRIDDVHAPNAKFSLLPVASFLAIPIFSRSGRATAALMFGHDRPHAFDDTTERLLAGVAATAAIAMDNARLFQEARDLIAALEKSNRELDQFAYITSHDLKAPLRGIANLSQWIEEDLGDRMDEAARQHMSLLRGRVVRLEYLIAGILAYSRAARDPGDRAHVELGSAALEAWELLSPPDTAHLTVAPNLPELVGSRTQLQQVLMNLLGNAIKYNPDRELHIEVGARVLEEDNMYEVFVRDDGVGIAPEFHDKIWGLFQTLERRDKVESTGIGLSIVRKIVEAQGGRAWVESRPDHGATFFFTWPSDHDGEAQHG